VQGLILSHREFWCPMCRQLANTVLPILPDADGCTDPDRLVPNTEPALVRHVGDVLHAPYPKQVTLLSLANDCCLIVFLLPCAGFSSCRIGPIRFLAKWHNRRLNQALVSLDLALSVYVEFF